MLFRPVAREPGAEVQVVTPGTFAHETDLGDVRPRATVRTAGHAHRDCIFGQPGVCHRGIQAIDQPRQVALALGHGQAAGRKCHTCHGVEPQRARLSTVLDTVLGEQAGYRGFVAFGDIGDDQILVWRQPKLSVMRGCDVSQSGHESSFVIIHDPAVLDEERVMPLGLAVSLPAVAVAVTDEGERPRRLQCDCTSRLDFAAEPVEAPVVNRVLQTCVLAIRPVTVVALRGYDCLCDSDELIAGAVTEYIGKARIGLRLAVRHAHATPTATL